MFSLFKLFIGIQFFNIIVLSVIIAPHNILTPQISIGIQFFNIVVLSVIIAPHSVVTLHISKIHLPIFPLNEP